MKDHIKIAQCFGLGFPDVDAEMKICIKLTYKGSPPRELGEEMGEQVRKGEVAKQCVILLKSLTEKNFT